jgi:nitrogen fixation protein NifU and related proteins
MVDAGYSDTLRDHLDHPRNVGPMPDADAVGVQANPICGDTLKLMLRIENDRVVSASWQTVGCEPARAASSIATELAIGRSLDEVDGITAEHINAAAGGIPASKMHAASLAAGALHRAIAAYRSRSGA